MPACLKNMRTNRIIGLALALLCCLALSAQDLKPAKDKATKKYGYQSKAKVWVIPPRFDGAKRFSNGAAEVELNGLRGLIDALVRSGDGDGLGDRAIQEAVQAARDAQRVKGLLGRRHQLRGVIGLGDDERVLIGVICQLGILACGDDIRQRRGKQHDDEQNGDSGRKVKPVLLRLFRGCLLDCDVFCHDAILSNDDFQLDEKYFSLGLCVDLDQLNESLGRNIDSLDRRVLEGAVVAISAGTQVWARQTAE